MEPTQAISLTRNWLARFGRRRHRRFAIGLPARVTTACAGSLAAELINLSATGAMVQATGTGLEPRRAVLLQWQGHAAFGRIVWAEGGRIGVAFDEMIEDAAIKMTLIMAKLAENRQSGD